LRLRRLRLRRIAGGGDALARVYGHWRWGGRNLPPKQEIASHQYDYYDNSRHYGGAPGMGFKGWPCHSWVSMSLHSLFLENYRCRERWATTISNSMGLQN
jgi:hypothetical protein